MSSEALDKVIAFVNKANEKIGVYNEDDPIYDTRGIMRVYREGDFHPETICSVAEEIGHGVFLIEEEGGYEGSGDEYSQTLLVVPLQKLDDAFVISDKQDAMAMVQFINANELDVLRMTAEYSSWDGIDWYTAEFREVSVTAKVAFNYHAK